MADVVQFKLERMLNELDDLEKRGLFSRREIAEIVKQRRKFEYRLKRPSPLKSDFLAYIDYEKLLDELRLLRKKKIGSKKSKKSVSDFAGVSRIVEIYRLATNRFKGDIQLWFQYLEFCRQRRNGRMKKALAQVIRFHPKVPGVWIYAAAWEFDHNLNVAAARALMQRGLRACPASKDLWVEYLRMELTYLNKLKTRKVALGEDEGTLIRDHREADEIQWRDENKELFMALRDETEKNDVQDETSKEKRDAFRENALRILEVVYSSAIAALPSSFELRTRFLEILESMGLAHSEDIRRKILADLKRDFSKDPMYWDWFAKLEISQPSAELCVNGETMYDRLSKAIQVYEEGLKIVPSGALFNLYVKFLTDALIHKKAGTQQLEDSNSSNNVTDLISHLLVIYGKAETMGCITEDLACQHVSFLLELGRLDEAKMQVEKFFCGKFSNSVHLWAMRISLETRCAQNRSLSSRKADLSSIFELLRNVLMNVSILEAENLWLLALKLFTNQRIYFDKLVEISVIVLAKDGGSDDGFSLSSTIVNHVLQMDGVQSAQEMYKRFIALPHPGLAIYKTAIELEFNLVSAGDKDSLSKARRLYESALTTYDQDMSLWRDYYFVEVKMGTSETAAAVHWRARKTLKSQFTLKPYTDW